MSEGKRKPKKVPKSSVAVVHSRTMYSVVLSHTSGSQYFAIGKGNGPAVFYWRRDAVKFRNELAEHINQIGRVVKVRYAVEEVEGTT